MYICIYLYIDVDIDIDVYIYIHMFIHICILELSSAFFVVINCGILFTSVNCD